MKAAPRQGLQAIGAPAPGQAWNCRGRSGLFIVPRERSPPSIQSAPSGLLPKAAMPVDAQLRSLNIDVPAQPEALVKLSLLLADDEVNMQALGGLIESDMAL